MRRLLTPLAALLGIFAGLALPHYAGFSTSDVFAFGLCSLLAGVVLLFYRP